MKPSEVPATDSGYPTPRDDFPSSSRSVSPADAHDDNQLTSTPVRGNKRTSMKEHFSNFRHELSMIESTGSDSISPENDPSLVLGTDPKHFYYLSFPSEGIKSVLAVSKEIKQKTRDLEHTLQENSMLREENESLHHENETLREENISLREESKLFGAEKPHFHDSHEKENPNLIIPKLQLYSESDLIPPEQLKSSEQIKRELLSYITNDEDRTMVETGMENKLISSYKPMQKVFTATATVQVDTETIDANVQTENDDAVSVINANLKLEVDQLNSQKEVMEQKNSALENRLFDYEKLKIKFEEDKQKLITDLEKKLKTCQEQLCRSEEKVADVEKKLKISHEKLSRYDGKMEDLQLRLNKRKKELDEVKAENQRLLEDKTTHDFELDEAKVHGEHIETQKKELEEKIEQLMSNIEDVQKAYDEEKIARESLEKDITSTKQLHENISKQLNQKVEDALARESAAREELELVRAENKDFAKENKYLSDSRQLLIDSESNLKSEINVLIAKMRDKDNQIVAIKEACSKKEKLCEQLEAELLNVEALNKKLNEDKYDSDELLAELKKRQTEIDHLRQLQMQPNQSDEVNQLKEEIKKLVDDNNRLKEKLDDANKKEIELETKAEDCIRSEVSAVTQSKTLSEEVAALKSSLDSTTQNLVLKEAEILLLERALHDLRVEFGEFQSSANLQYETDIDARNQQIESLSSRLVELETYPGQNISVSRKTTGVQTDEPEKEISPVPVPQVSIEEEEIESPHVSLVSDESIPVHMIHLEEKFKKIAMEMRRVISQYRVEDMSADIETSSVHMASDFFKKLADFLDSSLSLDSIEQDVDDLWSSLYRRLKHAIAVMEETVSRLKVENAERIQKTNQRWKTENEKLRNDLDEQVQLAEQRYEIAYEFKQHCEMEEKQKLDAISENERLRQLRNDELAERDQVERDLRSRLEHAEHTLQKHRREQLNGNDELEAELASATSKHQSVIMDYKRVIADLRKEVSDLERKRTFDKKRMNSMIQSSDIHERKCIYLQKRNTTRQKMIDYLSRTVTILRDNARTVDDKIKCDEALERIETSGLLKADDVDADVDKNVREVLGIINKK